MKQYTIGIIFRDYHCDEVALILKNRPKWQEGKYNFPGGHLENNETIEECVAREVKEECNIDSHCPEWGIYWQNKKC